MDGELSPMRRMTHQMRRERWLKECEQSDILKEWETPVYWPDEVPTGEQKNYYILCEFTLPRAWRHSMVTLS